MDHGMSDTIAALIIGALVIAFVVVGTLAVAYFDAHDCGAYMQYVAGHCEAK